MSEPISILIRLPNWLGDSIMALPAVNYLRHAMPSGRVILSGREPFRELFSGQPGIDGYVTAPASGAAHLCRGLWTANADIRAAGITCLDMGILLTNSLSTALWLWRTGARRRLGYTTDKRRLLLTDPVPCGDQERRLHFIDYYLHLVRAAESRLTGAHASPLAGMSTDSIDRTPRIAVTPAMTGAAEQVIRQAGLAKGCRYAVFAPASAYGEVKDWPPDHYRQVAATVWKEYGMPVVLTGGSGQATVCQRIASGMDGVVSVAGQTGLAAFAGLVAGCSLFIGGDSGGTHLAAAAGVPTVVIFGITNPGRTRPAGRLVDCVGSGKGRDVKLDSAESRMAAKAALAAITPEHVTDRVRILISGAIHG